MTTATLSRPAVVGRPAAPPAITAAPVRSAWTALAGTAASVPPIVLLHLDAPAGLSAARTTISDYVVTTPLGEPLFAVTTGGLAVAGIAVAWGLAGSVRAATVQVLLAAWAVALVAAAAFPTNRPGTPGTVSSTIHLIAGAFVFALLPTVGLLLWRRWRAAVAGAWIGRVLLATTVVGGALSTALIVNRIPGAIGLDQLMLPPGLLQRAAGAAEIVLAVVIATAMLRLSRAAVTGR